MASSERRACYLECIIFQPIRINMRIYPIQPHCVQNTRTVCKRLKLLLLSDENLLWKQKQCASFKSILLCRANVFSVSDQAVVDTPTAGASDRKSGRGRGQGRVGWASACGQRSRRVWPAAGQSAHQDLPTSEPPSAGRHQPVLRNTGGRGQCWFQTFCTHCLFSFYNHVVITTHSDMIINRLQ